METISKCKQRLAFIVLQEREKKIYSSENKYRNKLQLKTFNYFAM